MAENALPYLQHYRLAIGVVVLPIILAVTSYLHAAISCSLMIIFWAIIAFNQFTTMPYHGGFAKVTSVGMIPLLMMILWTVAPAKPVARRLIFLALGLLLLIGLNELSKLGLDLTAPKVQG